MGGVYSNARNVLIWPGPGTRYNTQQKHFAGCWGPVTIKSTALSSATTLPESLPQSLRSNFKSGRRCINILMWVFYGSRDHHRGQVLALCSLVKDDYKNLGIQTDYHNHLAKCSRSPRLLKIELCFWRHTELTLNEFCSSVGWSDIQGQWNWF